MIESEESFEATLVRNPYAIPEIAPREGTWISRGPILGSKVILDDPQWQKRLKPHERLFAHHTLNSVRKDFRLIRTKAPKDALDFALTSNYSHNVDLLVGKKYVYMQPETLNKETWRLLRNEIKILKKLPPRMGDNIYFSTNFDERNEENLGGGIKRRIHPSSLKLSIEGPHTDQTNPGFSRKIDGTLYSI